MITDLKGKLGTPRKLPAGLPIEEWFRERGMILVGEDRVSARWSAGAEQSKRPWLLYIDDKRVDSARGTGRRFATAMACLRAGKAMLEKKRRR